MKRQKYLWRMLHKVSVWDPLGKNKVKVKPRGLTIKRRRMLGNYAGIVGNTLAATGDGKILNLFVISLIVASSVGIAYLAYTLFVKDLILLLKEKRRRTTTESGFGLEGRNQRTEGNSNALN